MNQLWKALQAYYPHPPTFVPGIASAIGTWCDAFTVSLENEENEEQVERFIDALKGRAIRGRYRIATTPGLNSNRGRIVVDISTDLTNVQETDRNIADK